MKEKIESLVNRDILYLKDIEKELGVSSGAALEIFQANGFGLVFDQITKDDAKFHSFTDLKLKLTRTEEKLRKEIKQTKELTDTLQRQQEQLEVLSELSKSPVKTNSIKPSKGNSTTKTAVLMASDWHVGERVDLKSTNNLNEFNPDIARVRSENFFKNACTLIKNNNIDSLLIWLGGDFISSYLHPELEESNYLTPMEELMLAQELLKSGLDYLVRNSGVDINNIKVSTSYGNHGRSTEKNRNGTGAGNNYEWLMYHNLKNNTPELNWNIEEGYYTYLNVENITIRAHHGCAVRYMGGVGGLTIPLLKSIYRSDQNIKADYNILGHFHSLQFHRDFAVNGSLIGINAYALGHGFAADDPEQALFIVDSKIGVCNRITVPVLEVF